jgi:hypothetical protein
MEPVGEFTPCFLRVVARFSAHADPNTLSHDTRNLPDVKNRYSTKKRRDAGNTFLPESIFLFRALFAHPKHSTWE